MKAELNKWKIVDHYSNPGPIQYSGFGERDVALSLKMKLGQKTQTSEQIEALCTSIQNACMYYYLFILTFNQVR